MAKQVRIGDLNAHLAEPEGGSSGGMLLLPMIDGIGARVRTFAEDIANAGVTTLCWDVFHGASSDTHAHEDLFGMLAQLDDATAIGEQRALLEYMFGELGLRKVGVIGYCLGGRFALLLGAADQRVANVIAYHPTVPSEPAPNHSLDPFAEARRIGAPAMVHYPGQDTLVPRESFERLREGLESRAEADTITHLYPLAEHGFSNNTRHENPVNLVAYERSWPQTLEFIKQTVL
ncbi:dienelactone hydrolase family protein [Sciscionella sediminilitoris]|uniref:dienelactone hydrolase family protein n=1 Tax=Sciscionella sediminilitoris TaxID=1445613 RepID=UPI0004DEEEA0|nr:dienelactone hydrolase family protein [Sciscionella sp. SE31]